jgi:hypothetical protein
MLVTVTFAEDEGKTKLTLQHAVTFTAASERDAFEVGRDASQQGWTESLDRLAGDLAKARAIAEASRDPTARKVQRDLS